MKRRIFAIVALALALAGAAGPASAIGSMATSYWGCVGSDDLDTAVCLRNPLPDVPELPKAPRLPL
jgi:hypothetical protein